MRAFQSGPPRRSPWPYDAVIVNGATRFGVMLADVKAGQAELSSEQPNPLQAASPQEMAYSAQNPVLEATTVYDNLHMGMGQRMQIGQDDRRYRYTSAADCSVSGQIILGPNITSVTPTNALDTTNGILDFFELSGAGVPTVFALNGRYVKKRTADTAAGWGTTDKDFGVGKAALDVVVTKQNTAGSTTYAYIAMGDAVGDFIYRFDGTTYTQHVSLYALAFCVVGRELFRASGINQVAKVDLNSDPWTAANWSATNSFYVGDNTSAVVKMIMHPNGTLIIFKTDGVYVLDEEGQDIQLFKFPALNTDNGKYVWVDRNWVHCTYNGQHFRIDENLQLDPVGPERATDNSPVSGYVVAGAETPYCSFAGLYNPDSTDSHLMRFGAYDLAEDAEEPHRIDVWHGSLAAVDVDSVGEERQLTGAGSQVDTFGLRKIISMRRSTVGAPSLHEFLRIGCSDGTIHWFILSCKANPLGCSSYQYGTNNVGYVKFPYWHGQFPKEEKVIRAVTCTGTRFSASPISVAEKFLLATVGTGGSYTEKGDDGSGNGFLATAPPGSRSGVDIATTLGDFALRFGNSAAAATATPVITGLAVHYHVNPTLQQVWHLSILAEDGLLRRDGSPMRLGVAQLRTNIQTALATTAGVTLVLPDETSFLVQLSNYHEDSIFDEKTRQSRSVIQVDAAQSDLTVSQGILQALV